METRFSIEPRPTLVNVVAWMTLASGIVNLFWGVGLSLTLLLTIIGIICIPFAILPTVLGVFEIIYAAKLLSNPPQPVQPSGNIAVLEILAVFLGNVFSMVVGILALVFYNDLVVKDYFARLNGMPAAPVTRVEEASISDPNPAPIPPEPGATEPVDIAPSPQPDETPED